MVSNAQIAQLDELLFVVYSRIMQDTCSLGRGEEGREVEGRGKWRGRRGKGRGEWRRREEKGGRREEKRKGGKERGGEGRGGKGEGRKGGKGDGQGRGGEP